MSAKRSGDKAPILVFTSVFPNAAQPGLGVFVRERMFRVAKRRPVLVVAPVAWFPFQSWVRRWRPHFRPMPPAREWQDGIEVLHPRFFSIPGVFKWLDGLFMALASLSTVGQLIRQQRPAVIDSHFAYPDGFAAVLLGRRFRLPVTVTLRGTEFSLSRFPARRRLIVWTVNHADRVFTVANSLKEHVRSLGARTEHVIRVGNGVDGERFHRESRDEARRRLGISPEAKVLISVGGLCERKGFHRVMELLPGLLERHPDLLYLVVGGPSPEGDWSDRLRELARKLGVEQQVRFLGRVAPEALRWPLSAGDVFVLATSNEGWANVFLEAMACGLPVVTTDVGGNREVVSDPDLGRVVPFGKPQALDHALNESLGLAWDRDYILHYAGDNDWSKRVAVLDREFDRLSGQGPD